MRKEVRTDDKLIVDPNTERAEDLLEAIALDLDSLLKKMEDTEANANRAPLPGSLLPNSKER